MEEENGVKVDMSLLIGKVVDLAVLNNKTNKLFWYRGIIKYVNEHYLFLKKAKDGRLIVLNHNRILEIK